MLLSPSPRSHYTIVSIHPMASLNSVFLKKPPNCSVKSEIFPFRVLPGEDASCLNLYQPQKPQILGAPVTLHDEHPWQSTYGVGQPENGKAAGYRRCKIAPLDFAPQP